MGNSAPTITPTFCKYNLNNYIVAGNRLIKLPKDTFVKKIHMNEVIMSNGEEGYIKHNAGLIVPKSFFAPVKLYDSIDILDCAIVFKSLHNAIYYSGKIVKSTSSIIDTDGDSILYAYSGQISLELTKRGNVSIYFGDLLLYPKGEELKNATFIRCDPNCCLISIGGLLYNIEDLQDIIYFEGKLHTYTCGRIEILKQKPTPTKLPDYWAISPITSVELLNPNYFKINFMPAQRYYTQSYDEVKLTKYTIIIDNIEFYCVDNNLCRVDFEYSLELPHQIYESYSTRLSAMVKKIYPM